MECKCDRCGLVLSNKTNLIKHLKTKNPCNDTFVCISREDLIELCKKNKKRYKCEHCGVLFSNSNKKYQHKIICKIKSEIKEDLKTQFEKQFEKQLEQLEKQLEQLEQQFKNNKDNMEWTCDRCGKILTNKNSLLRHLRNKKPCKISLHSISREDLIEKYKTYKKGYRCEHCDEIFSSSNKKYQHKIICKVKNEIKEDLEKQQFKKFKGDNQIITERSILFKDFEKLKELINNGDQT